MAPSFRNSFYFLLIIALWIPIAANAVFDTNNPTNRQDIAQMDKEISDLKNIVAQLTNQVSG